MRKLLMLLFCLAGLPARGEEQRLVVHEWGTFTSLQDEAGKAVMGINTDDEPVPRFCHDLFHPVIQKPSEIPPIMFQGVPSCHPDVTMRLETPVIYFHPAGGMSLPITANVSVGFRGGWLTQFFPQAGASGFSEKRITAETEGRLVWSGLKIGTHGEGPQTTEHVWTAPRAVNAATVTATNGESEKFLFYRGVARLDCPLQIRRVEASKTLECRGQMAADTGNLFPLTIRRLWLASFQPDGRCAFRKIPSVTLEQRAGDRDNPVLFSTPSAFPSDDYSSDNPDQLRKQMRQALREEGMFADEADALLNTWELSYFKSAGLRLFFIVPGQWTDHYLPLDVSVPAEIRRAMVGRLELVTPEQRTLLKQLADAPVPTAPWAGYQSDGTNAMLRGTMPAVYRNLGRFRNALVLDEISRRPTESLKAFVQLNGLHAQTW